MVGHLLSRGIRLLFLHALGRNQIIENITAPAKVLANASDVAGSNELGTVPAGAWASVLREGTASATVRASAERVASSALCGTVHRLKNQIVGKIAHYCIHP